MPHCAAHDLRDQMWACGTTAAEVSRTGYWLVRSLCGHGRPAGRGELAEMEASGTSPSA